MSSSHRQPQKCSSMWIHCNRCFENYTHKQRSIYILSCYDVICEKCLTILSPKEMRCPICKNTVRGYPIGNNLASNLKELFHPQPWSLSFPKTWAVIKFQTKHRDNFLRGCRKLTEYNKELENERDRVKEQCKKLYLYQQNLKKEKAKLERELKKFMERKYAYKGLDKSRHSELNFELQRKPRERDHIYPFTCHNMSRSRNDDTFDLFPEQEENLSKSFFL